MEVKDIFSRRYGYDKPETLWEVGLPPDFHAALENTLVNLGHSAWWCSDYYRRVSLRCGWPIAAAGVLDLHLFCRVLASRPWHETYSALEEVLLVLREKDNPFYTAQLTKLRERLNYLLELKNINWRVNEEGKFDKHIENIAVIENALRLTKGEFDPAREHLKKAWVLFNKRPDPDYANSIKEAIAAVESASKIAVDSEKADLGKALDKLGLHPALKQGIEKLYGYASDEPGVRHGGTQTSDVDEAEAELMLTICASVMVFLPKKYKVHTEEGAA